MPSRPHRHIKQLKLHLRTEPSVLVHSDAFDPEPVSELEGRLKVISHRDFDAVVPLVVTEGYKEYKVPPNPVNQLGPVLADQIPVVTSSDKRSLLSAFNKRLNKLHSDDVDGAVLIEALSIIGSLPDLFEEFTLTDTEVTRWLSKFGGEKKKRMEAAVHLFCDASLTDLGDKEISVKLEALLKRCDATWAPRIICAGSDVYNAMTGPFADEVMVRLLTLLEASQVGPVDFKLAYKCGDTTYASWLENTPHVHYAEGDYSRNDSEQRASVTTIYLAWLRKLKMPDWFIHLERSMRDFSVHSRAFGIYGRIKNQLPTGATNTTNRNSMYNMTMFAVSCQRQSLRARALVLGDDLLAKTDRRIDCGRWVADVALFRMVLKGSVPSHLGDATILSRRLIQADTHTFCTVPKIGKALARFNVRATNNQSVSDDAYMAGKCLCYAYEFRHVPFLSNYFMLRFQTYNVPHDDLEISWTTRSNGITSKNILPAIQAEKVLISDECFLDWSMDVYGLGLCDWRELFEGVVLQSSKVLFQHPELAALHIDY